MIRPRKPGLAAIAGKDLVERLKRADAKQCRQPSRAGLDDGRFAAGAAHHDATTPSSPSSTWAASRVGVVVAGGRSAGEQQPVDALIVIRAVHACLIRQAAVVARDEAHVGPRSRAGVIGAVVLVEGRIRGLERDLAHAGDEHWQVTGMKVRRLLLQRHNEQRPVGGDGSMESHTCHVSQ